MTFGLAWWRVPRRQPIDDGAWRRLLGASPLFAPAHFADEAALRLLAGRFLHDKKFHGVAGLALDPERRLAIAALACLPVLHLGYAWLKGWRDIVVYPGAFRARRAHHDEATGVVTEYDEDLIGEAWERGPLVLSWDDIEHDLAAPFKGFNVVVHEIAHKLDMLDGVLDGTPRLPRHIRRSEWVAAMQPAFDAFIREVDAGRDTLVDPYAAENVEEFFAVTSELHFSQPETLKRAMPQVALMLARFYRGAPARAAR